MAGDGTPASDGRNQPDPDQSGLLQRAAAYLPSTLLAAIERHRGGEPFFIEPTDGTMLFADVSGFTPLSEGLAATGREGAERLTAVLNDFFGRMLTIAANWGGSNQGSGSPSSPAPVWRCLPGSATSRGLSRPPARCAAVDRQAPEPHAHVVRAARS